MNAYPVAIEEFHNTIMMLRGITGIESGVENLEPIDSVLLRQAPFAHLPHATLYRTGGGLENEVLIQFEIMVDYSLESMVSIEFLAWFVRDFARGGTKIQLRPFALPPDTPFGRQLGTSLKYHLELFMDGIEDSLEPVYDVIRRLDLSLNKAIDLYEIPLK